MREASRNDIIEIISERIPLKKSGSYYKACCPFHSEKTPSFYVHEIKGTYKCFGCSAWGDAISFIVHYDGLTFNETIYLLADRYHLTISNKSRKKYQRALKKDDDILPGYSSVKAEISKSKHVYVAFKQGHTPFKPFLCIDGKLSLEAAKLLKKRASKIIFVAQDTSWEILKASFGAALKAELEVFAIPNYSNEFQEMDWVDYCSTQTTQKITKHDVVQLIAKIPGNIARSAYIDYATKKLKESNLL